MSLLRRLRPGSPRSEDGFTLVELMIASSVIVTALTMIAGVLTSGLSATALGRERQSATGLANQVLEQLRATPVATVVAGLGSNDLASTTDGNIVKAQGATCPSSGSGYTFGGETIRCTTYTTDPAAAPLVPHLHTATVGPTTYNVATYLTYYNNNLTAGTYRATAVVSWTSAVAHNSAKSVQAQTIIYTPPSGDTRCRIGFIPCQPAFTADAVQTPATANITGTINGMSLDHILLSGGRATSDLASGQTLMVKGVSQAASGELQLAAQSVVTVGGTFVSSGADNDPSGTLSPYNTATLSPPVAASGSLTDGTDTVNVSAGAGDTGSTTSATKADTTTPYNCPNLTSYPAPYTGNENDQLPCGGSTEKTGASVTAQAAMVTIGNVPVAAVTGGLFNATAITDINTAPATGRCTATTTPDGCSRAQLTRTAAEVDAGGLPSNLNALLKPAGFGTYFAQITDVSDSAAAEAGLGTAAPAASQTAGSVKVFCASAIIGDPLCAVAGYVTKTLAQITQPLTTPTLTITDPVLGSGTTISLSATITPGRTTSTSNCSGTCTRTTASATSTPPTVSVTESITVHGSNVLSNTITLDPGPITASASYVAATT